MDSDELLATSTAVDLVYVSRVFRFRRQRFGNTAGSQWKETWLILRRHGILEWFNDKHCSNRKGLMDITSQLANLKLGAEAIDILRSGKCNSLLPPPPGLRSSHFIAIPRKTKRSRSSNSLIYFCARNEVDFRRWVEQLANVGGKLQTFHRLCADMQVNSYKPVQVEYKAGCPITGDLCHNVSLEKVWRKMWNEAHNASGNCQSRRPAATNSLATRVPSVSTDSGLSSHSASLDSTCANGSEATHDHQGLARGISKQLSIGSGSQDSGFDSLERREPKANFS